MSGAGLLLGPTLKGVSRSFYLTLRVLPGGIREPVGLAYLLARAADTIADTPTMPPPLRLERLLAFRGLVQGPASLDDLDQIVAPASEGEASPAERFLLASLPDAFSFLESLPDFDREQVRRVVTTLTHGMELDLTRFAPPGLQLHELGSLSALDSPDELNRYTYLVAGCVGEFWTAVIRAHEKRLSGWDPERMASLGVRFGKALQLTNVLRDIPRDLRNGRCYLPSDELEAAGLSPSDLLGQSRAPRARRVLAALDRKGAGSLRRRGGIPAGDAPAVRPAAAGGAVADTLGLGDAGRAGPERVMARPGPSVAGQTQVGLLDDGAVVAGRAFGPAASAVDRRPAGAGAISAMTLGR